jgi:hypothetical protein
MNHTQGGVFAGKYIAELRGADGVLKDVFEFDNVVVDEGLNNVLNAALRNVSAQTAWYLGLYVGAYTPVATETAATVAANSSEFTGYTGGARPQWRPAVAAAKSVTSAAQPAVFTFSANGSINGAFLVSSSQISGTSGILMSIAAFTAAKAVTAGDQLTLTYVMTAASA